MLFASDPKSWQCGAKVPCQIIDSASPLPCFLVALPANDDGLSYRPRMELALFPHWCNNHRSHQSLGSMMPGEVHSRSPPPPRREFEPNLKIPSHGLKVSLIEGRRHLPIAEIVLDDARLAS